METPTHLFSPLLIRETAIRNRIFVSPMCQYSSTDGLVNNWHMVHLGSRAVGGAGLVMCEAVSILPEGRITYADLGIWNDQQAKALEPITQVISENGAVPGIQLAHAGRKASTLRPWDSADVKLIGDRSWQTVSSTSAPFSNDSSIPRALSSAEVRAMVDAFTAAAVRAVKAGFKVIEIHAAHGYLVHQFLSPLSNDRDDEYGGDFDGRTRLLMETVVSVRKAIGKEMPLFVRISATDWHDDGWTLADSVRLASNLGDSGVDLIDCSSGGILPSISIPTEPGYQIPLAEEIRRKSGVATSAVGLITSAEQADRVIRNGQADAVALARELLRDPYWPYHAARTLKQEIPAPDQYLRAW
jgi:2,4-dienoyl-CoA reductase-like NADH-dependent reductase (Old Yellow Enzyme family)